MSWEDRTKDQLRAIADEYDLDVPGDATKAELIESLDAAGIGEPGEHEVAGPQPGQRVPPIPITSADFQSLMANPDLPPEQQAAPPQDQLNPHLFPQR